MLSSDGGVLLLRQIDRGLGLTRTLAGCFADRRDRRFVEHTLPQLLAQRLYGLALGYEDLNDHEQLRRDPLLATACEKLDPLGQNRIDPADRGTALAGAATLNRLELSNNRTSRGHKLPHDPHQVEDCLLRMGVRCLPKQAREIVLDLDSMGHLVHGLQEGRHFSAYYDGYCYHPLYVIAGDVVLWAQLRTSESDTGAEVVAALKKIVAAIRQRSPTVRIIVRGDSGHCRPEIMDWCEAQREVCYCLGLQQNPRLVERLPMEETAHTYVTWRFIQAIKDVALARNWYPGWSISRRITRRLFYILPLGRCRFIENSASSAWQRQWRFFRTRLRLLRMVSLLMNLD